MKVRASHILVKTEDEAKQLMEKIKEGESFAKLAKEHSQCPSGKKGGDLGYFSRQKMVPAFEKFCFKHKPGEMGLVKTEFGWHIIKVTDHQR